MLTRRLAVAAISAIAGLVALFPVGTTGATSTPTPDTRPVGVALVGLKASGIDAVPVMTAAHTDLESGHTAYAFVDEHGTPIAPPAAELRGR